MARGSRASPNDGSAGSDAAPKGSVTLAGTPASAFQQLGPQPKQLFDLVRDSESLLHALSSRLPHCCDPLWIVEEFLKMRGQRRPIAGRRQQPGHTMLHQF